MWKFRTQDERTRAVKAGVPLDRSTLQDGRKHYAVLRVNGDGHEVMYRNLTGTVRDTLTDAQWLADEAWRTQTCARRLGFHFYAARIA